MKPPISYYGGKQRIARHIVKQIQAIPHTIYTEPFAGGLSVLYAKGVPPITNIGDYREVINDINKNLMTFWRVARNQPDELSRWIALTPYNAEDYRLSIKIYKNPENYSDIEIAWAVYIQCNMSFAKKINGGWGYSKYNKNDAMVFFNRFARLPECFARLHGIYIDCMDALDFIKKWDSPNTLFYCDPPYPGSEQGHYKLYNLEDYTKLCDLLDEIQGSYILSNYDQTITPKTAKNCISINSIMSASKDKTVSKQRTEKLWICNKSDIKFNHLSNNTPLPLFIDTNRD